MDNLGCCLFFDAAALWQSREETEEEWSEEVHGWVVSSLRIAILSAVISMDLVHLSKYNAYLCGPPSHPAAKWDVLHNLLLDICNMTGGTKKVFLFPSAFVSFLFFFFSFFFCRVPNFFFVAPDAFGKHSSFWGTKKRARGMSEKVREQLQTNGT
jgi:hypothetical protein